MVLEKELARFSRFSKLLGPTHSGLNQLEDEELRRKTKSVLTWIYIGLFRDSWRWSDKTSFFFRHWDPQLKNKPDNDKCAVTMLNDEGRWKAKDCVGRKTFFCYEGEYFKR